jgi:hypothetical protein
LAVLRDPRFVISVIFDLGGLSGNFVNITPYLTVIGDAAASLPDLLIAIDCNLCRFSGTHHHQMASIA